MTHRTIYAKQDEFRTGSPLDVRVERHASEVIGPPAPQIVPKKHVAVIS